MKPIGWVALGAGFIGLLILVLVLRSNRDPRPDPLQAKSTVTKNKSGLFVPAKDPGPPAPPEAIEKAVEEARIKSTYQNFRTAVATGNRRLQESLHRALVRDRATALRLAEAELANSKTADDRDIAQQTVEALRP